MSVSRCLFFIVTCLTLVIAPSFAGTRADSTVTVASVLKAAECPLSEQQVQTLASIKIGVGFMDIYRILYETFNDEQKAALIEALGPWQRYGEWLKTPRYIICVVMFENYGYPLTQLQVRRLKELPTDPPSATDRRSSGERKPRRDPMAEILTKEQMKVLVEAYQNRGGN